MKCRLFSKSWYAGAVRHYGRVAWTAIHCEIPALPSRVTERCENDIRMSFPWHFGNISRLRAEELLLNAKKNGSFLIRDSESIPNAHVLCLL